MPVMKPEALSDVVCRIFQAAGATEDEARLVANSLVTSNLAGHDSHGVIRVRQYLDSIAAGEMDPTAEPVIAHETATVTMVDAKRGFGQVAAHFAMRVTIEKARTQGLAATGLFNCTHVGRLGEWVEMAADEGLMVRLHSPQVWQSRPSRVRNVTFSNYGLDLAGSLPTDHRHAQAHFGRRY